jgi:hypothetical protein
MIKSFPLRAPAPAPSQGIRHSLWQLLRNSDSHGAFSFLDASWCAHPTPHRSLRPDASQRGPRARQPYLNGPLPMFL